MFPTFEDVLDPIEQLATFGVLITHVKMSRSYMGLKAFIPQEAAKVIKLSLMKV